MKKLWLRWALLTLFVIGLGVTFFNLGQWQLSRLEERKGSNAGRGGPREFGDPSLRAAHDRRDLRRRPVATRERHRRLRRPAPARRPVPPNAGATGWQIVTPLTATDGRTVLVDRGFGVRAPGTDFPSVAPALPAGTVTVTG